MEQMSWNEYKNQYEYTLEDGSLLTVSGDALAEELQRAESEGNRDAFEEMLDPTLWLPLAGENPDVEIIK